MKACNLLKYTLLFVLAFFVCLMHLKAQVTESSKKLSVTGSFGYTSEDLDWSIAGNLSGQAPNVYSELIWKDLQGPDFQLNVEWNVWRKFFLETELYRFQIISGVASDTDYHFDNRINPSFQANLKSEEGKMQSISAGLGFRFLDSKKYVITSVVGYRNERQFLTLLDYNEDAVEKINSSYNTRWNGPFISLRPAVNLSKKLTLKALVTYHQLEYIATADWNLIEQFNRPVSFRHIAKGYRFDQGLELFFSLNAYMSFGLSAMIFQSSTGTGIDELYLKDGTVLKTRFNGANRRGEHIGLKFVLFY
jgi:hypothetical protein